MSVILKKKSTAYGVDIPKRKPSAKSPIEPAPLPQTVVILPQQDTSTPSETLVKKGDKVLTGQKIADSTEFGSVPAYASVSGEVANVTTTVNTWGQTVRSIVITSDGTDTKAEFQPIQNIETISSEEILKKIRDAGVISQGDIPAHIKLAPPQDKKIDTIILDGCESEPYMTADHRVMLEYAEKILSGLNIIKRVLSPTNVYIAIGDDKEDAIAHTEKLIMEAGYEFKIVPIKVRYPVGTEKTLIKTILDREVPISGTPADVGAVMADVSTTKAIHDAIYEGKPYIERVVTVTGSIKNPKNLLVRFGTPIKSLIDYCGGTTEKDSQVIIGGPMMGISQFDLEFPVCNDTNSVLVMASQPAEAMSCINCGWCIDACPMRLMPCYYPKYVKVNRYAECQEAYIGNCIECGACAYACPAKIPIVQYIKVAKRELSRRAEKK